MTFFCSEIQICEVSHTVGKVRGSPQCTTGEEGERKERGTNNNPIPSPCLIQG